MKRLELYETLLFKTLIGIQFVGCIALMIIGLRFNYWIAAFGVVLLASAFIASIPFFGPGNDHLASEERPSYWRRRKNRVASKPVGSPESYPQAPLRRAGEMPPVKTEHDPDKSVAS